jgi:hypothetical protein
MVAHLPPQKCGLPTRTTTTKTSATVPPSPPAPQLAWRCRRSSSTSSSGSNRRSWQRSSPSPPRSPSTPDFGALQPGEVLHLPYTISANSILWQQENLGNPARHLVTVVKKFVDPCTSEECVELRLISSFGDHRLEQGGRNRWDWKYYMMCENEVDNNQGVASGFLTMAPGSAKFKKCSYLNFSPRNSLLRIEYKHLEPSRHQTRFDKPSTYRIINTHFGATARQCRTPPMAYA